MSSDWLHIPESGTFVSPSLGKYMIVSPSPEFIGKLQGIPGAQVQPMSEREWVASLPMHEDSVRVLSNLGWPTQGMQPFHFYYSKPKVEGMYESMPHQSETAAFMATNKRCYCFNTMRTGKTGSLVLAFDYLRRVRNVTGSVLIVATVSTLGGVWERTLKTTLRDRRVVKIYGGTGREDRLRLLRQSADFYIINYDGVKMIVDELEQAVVEGRINMIGVDELTHYGNPSSARWKALNRIINGKRRQPEYVCGLTGSPGGNAMSVFGMSKLVTPWILGDMRKDTWQNLCYQKYGSQVWQWRERPESKYIIEKALQPQIRFDKKDILNLPPTVTVRKEAELSSEQARPYRDLIDSMIALTKKGELITAVSKAALAHKLFQCALGSVIKEDGTIAYLDNTPRLEVIKETIEEAEAKVVIFCVYKAAIIRLTQQLKDAGISTECVHGDVTGGRRDVIFNDFLHARDPKVLVCHPTTTAFGTELASADTLIFDGPPRVGEFIYSQALERLGSAKQRARQITIVEVSATKEERDAFEDINNNVKAADSINRLFTELTRKG